MSTPTKPDIALAHGPGNLKGSIYSWEGGGPCFPTKSAGGSRVGEAVTLVTYHLEEESYEVRGAMWGKSEIEIVCLAPGFHFLVLSESHGQGHLRIGYSARMVDHSRLFA